MSDDIWTVKRILAWIEGYLAQHGDESARVSAQWLVSEALGMSRMQLFLDSGRPLTPDERAVLRDWTRRRAGGEPLQYITGEAAFRHITLKVRSGVLIPRPETEVLVSEALALLPAAPKPQDAYDEQLIRHFVELGGDMGPSGDVLADDALGDGHPSPSLSHESARFGEAEAADSAGEGESETGPLRDAESKLTGDFGQAGLDGNPSTLLVADICTGSGCIACSLASEHPHVRVVATDISPEAVELARENVSALDLDERVKVLECDLGSGIDSSLMGDFDLVVSNPPYVPTGVLAQLPKEVGDHEPSLALDGGEDGLDVFRRLLSWCQQALAPDGSFAFELHETCLDAASEQASLMGFSDIRIVNDLADRPRVLTGRKVKNA